MINNIHFGKTSIIFGTFGTALILIFIWTPSFLPKDYRFLFETIPLLSIILAFLGIASASTSFIKNENIRYSIVGSLFACLALLLNFIWLFIVLIIVFIAIAYFYSGG